MKEKYHLERMSVGWRKWIERKKEMEILGLGGVGRRTCDKRERVVTDIDEYDVGISFFSFYPLKYDNALHQFTPCWLLFTFFSSFIFFLLLQLLLFIYFYSSFEIWKIYVIQYAFGYPLYTLYSNVIYLNYLYLNNHFNVYWWERRRVYNVIW